MELIWDSKTRGLKINRPLITFIGEPSSGIQKLTGKNWIRKQGISKLTGKIEYKN